MLQFVPMQVAYSIRYTIMGADVNTAVRFFGFSVVASQPSGLHFTACFSSVWLRTKRPALLVSVLSVVHQVACIIGFSVAARLVLRDQISE